MQARPQCKMMRLDRPVPRPTPHHQHLRRRRRRHNHHRPRRRHRCCCLSMTSSTSQTKPSRLGLGFVCTPLGCITNAHLPVWQVSLVELDAKYIRKMCAMPTGEAACFVVAVNFQVPCNGCGCQGTTESGSLTDLLL